MSSDSELSDFSESPNDDENIDVMYSQCTPYRIAISSVVLSTPLRHQDSLAARFEDHF